MKGFPGGRHVGRAGAAFSTDWCVKGGRYFRIAGHFKFCSRSIFQAETSKNISKFLVIIFACNLHRDV
ncbi:MULTISPECIES: hypothetical protein [unclassified Burkholderia]|uniref:hypothetical protein n=1 Tax=unclassified Burkholderia TaxID=2613784 RepID=UPI00163A3D27|nr:MULTISPECIES: hypothetical protein [unclassified Burkholderia]